MSSQHVRGTPYHVRPGLLRLALVVAAVFLAFPALSTPLFLTIKGAEKFPPELVLALLTGGAASWAAAAFTSSSAWLALGLGGALAAALRYLAALGIVPPTLALPAAAPLLVAGVLSAPALAPLDIVVVVGLIGGLTSRGVGTLRAALSPEAFALLGCLVLTLVASPGLIGYPASRALSPLSTYQLQAPAAVLSVLLAVVAPSTPTALTALLTVALLVARALTRAPEPTEAAQQNARASHWLLAGALASLATLHALEPDDTAAGAPAATATLALLLIGSGIAVLLTALLAATARVWGPVRSGEFQMVTLDFLALCAYFVAPLLFVWYLAGQQLAPHLPALPAAAVARIAQLRELMAPLLPSHPLAQTAALAFMVVATQEAFEESSILWAHWLVRTYTLGALDTKHVALVARLEPLLAAVAGDDPTSLPAVLKASGVPRLNLFVSPELAEERADVCRALSQAGHILGLETAAGPFAPPFMVTGRVTQGYQRLKALLSAAAADEKAQALAWYAAQGGHRNPWALWRASALNLHFVAPAHRVVLGDNAGVALRALLDPWCRGGIVGVEVGSRVDLLATLKDLKAHADAGGYVLDGLAAVCPEVQPMTLSTEH